ncbi:GTP-binding protein [Jeotgalicoccus sp. WY2]|uniref:GTP-binding protein n=1 Tax=Jeotgalicoccus sp. WY2 TaxID=2708346 RepID=UPI0035304155
MPQTRFVLKKALEQNLKPVVVVNKIDKPSARPEEVVDDVLELFIELDANDEQLEFPVVYASAMNGTASLEPDQQDENMQSIYDTILDYVPAPVIIVTSRYSSRFHYWTTTIMLAVSESDAYSAERLTSVKLYR